MFSDTNLQGNLVIPEGVTEIESHAFNGTQITSVTLPSSIRVIEDGAFANIRTLTTVNIPESVGSNIFSGIGQFSSSSNVNLASQARLRTLGYTGGF